MVKIIGGGLAGCEAAWQLARFGIESVIYEMKPEKYTHIIIKDSLNLYAQIP